MTTERIDGPTPAGGAYALALFSDEPGVAVEKRQATRVTITEYEAEGNRLAETHGGVPAQRVADAERGASRFTAPTPGGASRSAGRRRAGFDDPTGRTELLIGRGAQVCATPTGPFFAAADSPAHVALLTASHALDDVESVEGGTEAQAKLRRLSRIPPGAVA